MPLEAPMRRALELAWESFAAGSLGIGAVITLGDEVIATGRNRLAEPHPGDDVLAGTSLAHAELNALAKLSWGEHRDGGLVLWTTLQPCLQCLGAIRMSVVEDVRVLSPDPLFRGLEGVRDVNEFVASRWPEIRQRPIDEWAVLSLVLTTHVTAGYGIDLPGWREALSGVSDLADELAASGWLVEQAANGSALEATASGLWDRLGALVEEVQVVAT